MRRDAGNALDALRSAIDTVLQDPDIVATEDSLARLEEAAESVGRAWSGSWLGYQARVYYKGFQPPPPDARFNPEWGLMGIGIMNDTTGDWVEYQDHDVMEAIRSAAGGPDLAKLRRRSLDVRREVEDAGSEIVSILAGVQAGLPDEYLRSLQEKAEGITSLSANQIIRGMAPGGSLMSRDGRATSQGLQTPPHIKVIAESVQSRDRLEKLSLLGRLASQAVRHIQRSADHDNSRGAGGAIFIGHGRSPVWLELKDFIGDRLGLSWAEFNRVSSAGVPHSVRLNELLESATFAFLVLTGEDEDRDGKMHARENVVHEAGLFQGRLGFGKSILLVEEGCEKFSNIEGLGQIRFPKGSIHSVLEDIRKVLEREGVLRTDDEGPKTETAE